MLDVSELTREAINQNNVGVALIAEGNYRKSVRILSRAMRNFQSIPNFLDEIEDQEGDEPDYEGNVPSIWSLFFEETKTDKNDVDSSDLMRSTDIDWNFSIESSREFKGSCKNDDVEDGTVYLYREAIEIPPIAINHHQAPQMICTIVTFNLGLAHQLLAVTTTATESKEEKNKKNNPETLMRKASIFYDVSYSMLKNEFGLNSSNIWFVLAVVNNLGFCHCLATNKSARKYFEFILSLLIVLVDNGLEDIKINMYLWNVCAVLHQRSAAPAA